MDSTSTMGYFGLTVAGIALVAVVILVFFAMKGQTSGSGQPESFVIMAQGSSPGLINSALVSSPVVQSICQTAGADSGATMANIQAAAKAKAQWCSPAWVYSPTSKKYVLAYVDGPGSCVFNTNGSPVVTVKPSKDASYPVACYGPKPSQGWSSSFDSGLMIRPTQAAPFNTSEWSQYSS